MNNSLTMILKKCLLVICRFLVAATLYLNSVQLCIIVIKMLSEQLDYFSYTISIKGKKKRIYLQRELVICRSTFFNKFKWQFTFESVFGDLPMLCSWKVVIVGVNKMSLEPHVTKARNCIHLDRLRTYIGCRCATAIF